MTVMWAEFVSWFYANVWGNIVASAITTILGVVWAKRRISQHLYRQHAETRALVKDRHEAMQRELHDVRAELKRQRPGQDWDANRPD